MEPAADMRVIGRRADDGPVAELGRYRAWDGSPGDPVALDVDAPHVITVVGKRGSGKSHTLGVLVESLREVGGTVPVVLDPMAAIGSARASDTVSPSVRATAIPPRSWPALVGLEPTQPAGTLVWRAAAERSSLAAMLSFVEQADAVQPARRAAVNHLQVAAAWDVFAPEGLTATSLLESGAVVDLSGLDTAPTNAVARAVMEAVYRASLERSTPLPWVLVDEAHVLFDGIARPAVERLLRRGRQPGISLVLATQRPTALPDLAVSQADMILTHRVTGSADRERLRQARQAYFSEALTTRLPERPGEALVIDDTSEAVHPITVRNRDRPHPGESPRVSETITADGRGPAPACED